MEWTTTFKKIRKCFIAEISISMDKEKFPSFKTTFETIFTKSKKIRNSAITTSPTIEREKSADLDF